MHEDLKKMYTELGISEKVASFGEEVCESLKERFAGIDEIAEINQLKVIHAMQKNQEIQEEQQVMLNQIADAINQFILKYNEEKKYSMILTGVFLGDPALDITNDIIEGLNEEYIKNKKKAVSSETETETKTEETQAK